MKDFDIDIDTTTDVDRKEFGVPAMMCNDGNVQPHPNGIYILNQNQIPIDSLTGLCAIPYKEAPNFNLFKIDILHNTGYDIFTNKEELLYYQNLSVVWSDFNTDTWIRQLPQIHNHSELVRTIQPHSLDDLADTLALIRPAKRSLVERYIRSQKDKDYIRRNRLYKRPTDGKAYFKKSHSYAYALMIVTIFNKLHEQDQD